MACFTAAFDCLSDTEPRAEGGEVDVGGVFFLRLVRSCCSGDSLGGCVARLGSSEERDGEESAVRFPLAFFFWRVGFNLVFEFFKTGGVFGDKGGVHQVLGDNHVG